MDVVEGYKYTKIGRIPKEFNLIELGKLCKIVVGGTPSTKKEEFWNGNISWLSSGEIKNNIINKSEKKITDLGLKKSAAKLMKKNTVLLAMTGATLGRIGFLGIDSCGNQSIAGFLPNDNYVSKYLFYHLQYHNRLIFSYASGAAQPGINKKNIERLLFLNLPLPEQQKIADILSTVDEQISTTQAIIDKSKELKKGLMQKLFSEGIGHTEFKDTKIGRIPKDWGIVPAQEICEKVTDGTHDSPKRVVDGYKLVTSKNLKNGELDFSTCYNISEEDYKEVNKRSYVEQYDVLFGMIGTIGSPVMIQQKDIDFAVKNVGIFKTRNDAKLGTWLCHYFNSYVATNFIKRQKNSSTQSFVALGFLRKFPILNPTNDERDKISDILTAADAKIEKEENEKAKLEELKKGLMQQLLTGKKRVKV